MKKVLVYGLGVTGISTVKTLEKLGYDLYTYDKNKKNIKELEGYKYSPISDLRNDTNVYEFVVKSPGIKPTDPAVEYLSKKFEIISDIELSYRIFPDKEFIAITGTNGKTSTTSMISHILNDNNIKAYSVGNIGEGILWQMYEKHGVFVEELSSFQLHDTSTYKPHIANLLNINEDHIDWHGSFDDYIESKCKIASNQDENDFLIVNAEDKIIKDHKEDFKAKIYEFSSKSVVNRGLYFKDGSIYLNDDNIKDKLILDVKDLSVIGIHNYENVMAAMLSTYLYGLDIDKISKSIKSFKSIAHRLEYVATFNNIDIYNDSKGTNVDSSVKAIESFSKPIIIIAGGYDKHIDYTDYVKAFQENGKLMVLMGETKHKLENLCKEYNITYKMVEDMQEALEVSFKEAKQGDVILLSPASASWDMYESYVKRGEDFKKRAIELGKKLCE